MAFPARTAFRIWFSKSANAATAPERPIKTAVIVARVLITKLYNEPERRQIVGCDEHAVIAAQTALTIKRLEREDGEARGNRMRVLQGHRVGAVQDAPRA